MSQYNSRFGWLYCVQHPRELENVKIGMTSVSMESRLRSANTFSTEPFRILHAKYIREPYKTEQIFHQIFEPFRVLTNREFFRSEVLPNVIAAFKLLPGIVHPDSEIKQEESLKHDFEIRFSDEPEKFWDVFENHFIVTGQLYDRVRISTIRSTLFANGVPENTDVVVELMRNEHFPDSDGFYVGIRSVVMQTIESFAACY